MSSILKALKKLEDESASPVVDHTWLKNGEEKVAGFERLKDHFIKHLRIYGTLALLLLVLAAGGALKTKLDLVKTSPEPLISAKHQMETASPPSLQKNESAAQSEAKPAENIKPHAPKTRPKEIVRLSTFQPVNQGDDGKFSTAADRPAALVPAAPAIEPRQPAGSLSTAKSFMAQPDSKPAVETHAYNEKPDLQAPPSSEPDRFKNVEALDDPDMELQAISWSENTEKRLAVINDKIVRSGDRIGSYIVLQINPDDVIVRQGEDLWKIPFKLR